MEIEKLSYQHSELIKSFDCGNEEINDYLINRAYYDCDCVTHLILSSDKQLCIGYFSLSCAAIYLNDGYKIHTRPAVEIKFFAIDKNYQGKKYNGDTYASIILAKIVGDMIYDFTEEICEASRIILYSTPRAVNFYKRARFEDFNDAFYVDQSSYLDGCTPMIYYYE